MSIGGSVKKEKSVINANKPSRSFVIIYMICKLASLWMIYMHKCNLLAQEMSEIYYIL